MAEYIVEHVGFLDVVECFAGADEIAGRETAIGKVPEEYVIGDQHWHGYDRPTG